MPALEKDVPTRLLEAATLLFARRGFAAVSIRELAKAADVNVAAISYYFSGKEGLYAAVIEHQFAPIAAALSSLADAGFLSPTERLSLYAGKVAGIHRQRPYLFRIFHGELVNPTACYEAIVKKNIARIFEFLRQALIDGIAAGEFRSDLNVGPAVICLAGIINFYFFVAKPLAKDLLSPDESADEDAYAAQAFQIYLNGIKRRGKDE